MKLKLILILFSFFILLYFYNRGFAYYDEGFILHAAQRVLRGEVPYRDFDLIYTPGTIYLTAFFFRIFGESILTGRLLMLLVSSWTSYLVYLICFKTGKNKLGSLLAVLIYLAWGPTHINFPWPSMLAITTGLLTIYFLENAFLAGLFIGVTFLMKQNFAAAVLLMVIIQTLITGTNRRLKLTKIIIGLSTGMLPLLIYLQSTQSLGSFISNFQYYTLKNFLFSGTAATYFPTGFKGIFYLLPVLISGLAIFLNTKNRNFIILPLFSLLFFIFGIRPTSDYPHLTVLMATVGLPLSLLLTNNQDTSSKIQKICNNQKINIFKKIIFNPPSRNSPIIRSWGAKLFPLLQDFSSDEAQQLNPRSLGRGSFNNMGFFWNSCWLLLGISLILLGFHTSLFKNYYRWDSPLIKQTFFLPEEHARIFVDGKFSFLVPKLLESIKQVSNENNYLFVFPNAPMFYFLSGKINPTRFINFPDRLHTMGQEREIIRNLGSKKVNLLLVNDSVNFGGYKIIENYIRKNYEKIETEFEFSLWKIKPAEQ